MRQDAGRMLGKVRFGVYELDRDAMELRKHGVTIRLQEQPLRVLSILTERPGGIVTREELRDQIWAKDTFVDFDQSLNKAVNRVREALNDDAARPQYVETVPRRGYRFVAPITEITSSEQNGLAPSLSPPPAAESTPPKAQVPSGKMVAMVVTGVLIVAGIAAAVWLKERQKPVPQMEPRHMTSAGFDPALSKDGKLLAYTANGSSNVLHIWVKQTAGGEAVPVTSGPDPDCCVDISPDGTRIAFASERGGGGTYIAPTLSGEPRFLANNPGASHPFFSPAGDTILYLQNNRPFTVSVEGGTPVALPLAEEFRVHSDPHWSPTGNEIIFYGANGQQATEPDRWWIAPLKGGKPRLANLPGLEADRTGFPAVRAWTRTRDGRDWIVYSVSTEDTWKLFRVESSRNGEVGKRPQELASGAGVLAPGGAFAEDGKLAYSTLNFGGSIFEVPINERGQKQGPTVQLSFSEEGSYSAPSVSRDGRWLLYGAYLLGKPRAMMLRDLRTGVDRFLDDKAHPIDIGGDTSISPDGSKIIFGRDCPEGKRWPNGDAMPCGFMLSPQSRQPEQICENCTPRGFSSDGSVVLAQKYHLVEGREDKIVRIDLAARTEEDFLNLPDQHLFHPFFSWDDRWVVFKEMKAEPALAAQIFITPVRQGVPGKEAEWIAVTDGLHQDDKPQFSADGHTVFFTSTRDGYVCIWAQKLDPVTRHPVGPPVGFEHFHNSAGRDAVSFFFLQWDLTVARDKMLINLPRISTEIWMVQTE